MKSISFFLMLMTLAFAWGHAEARTQEFVEIGNGRSLYVDWSPARNDKPTVVLLNGLTYSTESWNSFAESLARRGFGVLRYDPAGMGKTLERMGTVTGVIRIEDQARDLNALTKALGLTGKLNLLGLSYGGGLAITFAKFFPERVGKAILMAPFTKPLADQDAWIRAQIMWTRATNPLNPATFEQLYAYFLRQNVYYLYPLTEPSMRDSDLKPEAVFQMTQGIRKFNMLSAAKSFPSRTLHLMVAGRDQYIPRDVMDEFWNEVPDESKASRFILQMSEHKIPEDYPAFSAAWVTEILNGNKDLYQGRSFTGNPLTKDISNLTQD